MSDESRSGVIRKDLFQKYGASRFSFEPIDTVYARLSEHECALRRLLALAYSNTNLYTDDGELQDNRFPVTIDFMRDSVETIEDKISDRGMLRYAESLDK